MGFYIFISVLVLIVCVLLGLIVLIQNPKGGGLSSTFGGQGNQMLGVRKTADFLEKGTWILASALLFLSLISAYIIPRNNSNAGGPTTELTVDASRMALPTTLPAATEAAPVEAAPAAEVPATPAE